MTLDLRALDPAPTKVVANLPYGIAAGAILRTIEELDGVTRWVAMVQSEVGERFAAAPGTAAYGVPSVLAQLACDVRVHRAISRTVFHPVPERRLGARRARAHAARRRRPRCARSCSAAFAHRRKALARSLALAPGARPRRARPRPRGARGARPPGRRARRAPGARGVPRARRRRCGDRALHDAAPGEDQPLPVRRAATRADGRHELVTVFQPIDARRRGRARAGRLGAGDDEVICPGVDGDEPRRRRAAALPRADRAGPARRCGCTIDKRIPVAAGMAGGSADAGAALRLAARAAGIDDDDAAARDRAPSSAPTSPRRCARGATWRPAPASACAPLPAAGALRRARPARRATQLSTADVYREADRLGLAARRGRARGAAARGRRTAAGDLPDELVVNDLEPAARALCPAIDDALAAVRGAGADHALVCGSGPTVLGLFADLDARARRPRARCPTATRARSPSRPLRGRRCEARLARRRRRARRLPRLAPAPPGADAAGRRRARRRRPPASTAPASSSCPNLEQLLDRRRRDARPVDLPARRRAGLPRDRRVHRARSRPGETAMLLGGLVAGQGQIDVVTLIAIVWACAVAGDLTSFFLGRRLGRAFLVKHGAAGEDHRGAPGAGRGLLRPPRRQGDPHRALRRPRARDRAVPRRLVGHAAAALPALRRRRRRPVGHDVRPARLHLLAELQHSSSTTPRRARSRSARSSSLVVGDRLARALAARARRTAGGCARWHRAPGRAARAAAAGRASCAAGAHAARGPARFVWDRLTPGDLGLELTTLLAVAAVGAFVVRRATSSGSSSAALLVGRRHGAAPGRPTCTPTRLVDVAKVVTRARLAAGGDRARRRCAGVVLAARREIASRRWRSSSASRSTYAAVHITKDAVDRPRPPRPLVDTDGAAAIPSGHAAYAVAWVAVAVALSRALPGLASRVRVRRRSAIVIAVVVGLSRVYLRAHYLTDVIGGLGLGAALFALCGLVALVVGFVRDNAARAEPAMSNESIIYLVAACSGVLGLAAYIGLILVPAWTAYSRVWERLAATFLSLYVLAAFVVLGVAGGAAIIWFWDRLARLTIGRLPGCGCRRSPYNPVPCPLRPRRAATGLDLAALDAITDAVESGAGLPEVVRAAARALDASLVLTDRARRGARRRRALAGRRALAARRRRRASRRSSCAWPTSRSARCGCARAASAGAGAAAARDDADRLRGRARARARARLRGGARPASCARCSAASSPAARTSLGARRRARARPRRRRQRRRRPRALARADRGRLARARARRRRARRARRRAPAPSPALAERADAVGRRGRRAAARRRRRDAPRAPPRRVAARAAGRAARPHLRPRPQPRRRRTRSTCTARGQRGAAGRQRRRGRRRAPGRSRSRRPAPTACCCRR